MLRENWNVLRLLNRKKVPGYPQRRTKAQCMTPQGGFLTQDIACLQEQPQEFKDQTELAIRLFTPFSLVSYEHSLFYLQLFILSAVNLKSLPATFLPTHISIILPVSSIIIFSPSLSWLLSSPPFLPVSPHNFSFFSTILSFNPLHFTHQNLSFSCHHLSVAAGEVCVPRYADLFVEAVFAQTDTG